jgi:hypothetical protein
MDEDDEPEAVKDARRYGLPEGAAEAIRSALADAAGEPVAIWPVNLPIVEAFLVVASQWRVIPIGGGMTAGRLLFLGLDYAGARAGIEAAGLCITPELWAGVRIMEAEARSTLNGAGR